jgi:hypothetical protein
MTSDALDMNNNNNNNNNNNKSANEELHKLYPSPKIIRMIKSRMR